MRIQQMAQRLNHELVVEASLTTGFFYLLRAVVSEQIGAEFLIAYGLLKEGAKRIEEKRYKLGSLMAGGGVLVTLHVAHAIAMQFFYPELEKMLRDEL